MPRELHHSHQLLKSWKGEFFIHRVFLGKFFILFFSIPESPENKLREVFNSIWNRLQKLCLRLFLSTFNHFTVCFSLHTRTLCAHLKQQIHFVFSPLSFVSLTKMHCGSWTIYFHAFKINLVDTEEKTRIVFNTISSIISGHTFSFDISLSQW